MTRDVLAAWTTSVCAGAALALLGCAPTGAVRSAQSTRNAQPTRNAQAIRDAQPTHEAAAPRDARLASADAGAAAPAPIAATGRPVPSPRQLARDELELCAFVHFGMNTFTDREWGDGREDPRLFAPTDLDCDQWVTVFAEAGFGGVILTAKHHDGFCLWPSKFTEHSVKNSPWKDGQGDVVRELSDACRRRGLKFGVYLSPWDRNSPLYGDVERYNDYYAAQLTELLTNYGEIFEVWWDGACGEGPNGKRQVYDWPRFTEIVRRLQPNAVIFSDAGPDLRWVGNENGFAGETCWSTFSNEGLVPGSPGIEARLNAGDVHGTHWIPPECDVSIRPGWFHHPAEDGRIKSVDELMAIWKGSVGRNGLLLLNVPADRHGRIAWRDELRLREFGRAVEYAGSNRISGILRGERALQYLDFAQPEQVAYVDLSERVARGQFVESFELSARRGESWVELARGTTLGRRRRIEFEPIVTDRLQIRLTSTLGPIDLGVCTAFGPLPRLPQVRFATDSRELVAPATVELACDMPDVEFESFFVSDAWRSAPLVGSTVHLTDPGTYTIVASAKTGGSAAPRSPALARARPRDDATAVESHYAVATFRVKSSSVPLPSVDPGRPTEPGLTWTAHAPSVGGPYDFEQQPVVASGESSGLRVALQPHDVALGLVFRGWILVDVEGDYTFGTNMSEPVHLVIAGRTLLRPAHTGESTARTGSIALQRGLHEFRFARSDSATATKLDLWWTGPGFERRRLPDAVWRH